MVIHTIKLGDSVYSLSRRYGVPVQKIITDNNLEDAQRLMAGQSLIIMTDNVRHTVAPGDSLYRIAQTYGTTVNRIMTANPEITNPARITPGQVINIPVGSSKLGTIDVNGYAFPTIRSESLNNTLPYLTYLSMFSYQVRPDGSLIPIPDDTQVQAARAARVAPLMVITNIKEGASFDTDLAHTILTTPEVQNRLLDNVVATLKAKNYYGLDIDFEYIRPADRENYNAFLRKTVEKLHPLGYTVTTALAPKTSGTQRGLLYEAHDYAVHGQLVDHVILMTYEWGYTYGPAQAVAPLDQVERVIQYAVSVIPSKKILLGMPNYGYDWTLPFVRGSAAKSISNQAAINLAMRVGAQIQFDPKAQAPHFNYYDAQGKRHEVWFDDARSIEARLKLVDQYDLAGVSYWNINTFFKQNWLVLQSMYDIRKVL